MTSVADFRYFPRPQLVTLAHTSLNSGLAHAITMFAGRRMGKTQFVKNDLLPATESWRWRGHYIDLWVRRNQPELGLVEELEAATRSPGVIAKALKPSKLKAKAGIGASAIEIEWSKSEQAGDLQGRLRTAMRALVDAGSEPVLLCIDEFQTLANGKHADFVATFRAAMIELQPRLKLFFTGSSRHALNSMFKKRKSPLFEAALALPLPNLGRDFVQDRAAAYANITMRQLDVDQLDRIFAQLGHVPLYLNQVLLHAMVDPDSSLDSAFARWKNDIAENGLGQIWQKLQPVDKLILAHLVEGEPANLYSNEFSEYLTRQLASDKAFSPQRVQSVIKRLVNNSILAPVGDRGEVVIEDRALALYVRDKLQQ